ncbi:cannabinoid receptor type 1B-like [Actinia tenebrosa]|uniref:Cannabinoid receptor type 1B-like n=1 Tax=Actinia tenebrosa TaxID=6105 RepID=A0A6P8HWF3_ACTTE|nr:cannabinoid receptor type 1B-like [Actinia tenebrosa]
MANPTTNATEPAPNWQLYGTVETFTVVFLSFLALGTTTANGFTLYTIYKDPLKCFRTPLTIFIAGILVSDFLTGLIVEPVLAILYSINYIHIHLLRTIQVVAMITINTSFFIILALAIAQFMALKYPIVYERWFTNRSSILIIACVWAYSCTFSLLPEIFSMSMWAFYTVDLILNTTLVTIALVVIYVFTYIVFKRKNRELGENNEQPNQRPASQRAKEQIENDFLKGTFLLTVVLIVTVWPFMIALYIWIFNPYLTMAKLVEEYTALIICENLLYLKFLWDPLIFIMRVSKYRKAVVMEFTGIVQRCGCGCIPGGAGVVVYNRYVNEETTRADADGQEETVVEEAQESHTSVKS